MQTAEELDEYTYLVAGCVGEFWTRLCLNHLPDCSALGLAELRRLGAEYGKGLQLVNILRDFPEDLRNGRCYLPETELRAAGTSPMPLIDQPAKAQAVFDRWRERAGAQLEHGFEYIAALRSARLRVACFLPWYLGLRTLRLLGKPGALWSRRRRSRSRGRPCASPSCSRSPRLFPSARWSGCIGGRCAPRASRRLPSRAYDFGRKKFRCFSVIGFAEPLEHQQHVLPDLALFAERLVAQQVGRVIGRHERRALEIVPASAQAAHRFGRAEQPFHRGRAEGDDQRAAG